MQDFIVTILIICASVSVLDGAVPNYFKVCHRSDPHLGQCVTKAVYDLLPRLKVGIPEYDIPKIEPFELKDVNFTTGTESVRIRAILYKISVFGGSTFDIKDVTINPNKNTFHFKVTFPRLRFEGDYEVDGKVLFLNLQGKGPLHANGTDVFLDCRLKGNKVPRNGAEYLQFEKMKCNVQYGSAKIKLENLFSGNAALGKSADDILQDNLDAFIDALKPSLVDAVATIFTNIGNNIASRFNYNEFFPK